jgi:hypothetical protein
MKSKPWIGLGNPCTPCDHDLFEATTTVTIGNGKKALFWEAACYMGCGQKVWHLSSLSYQKRKGARFAKLGRMSFGSLK